jgi:DNA repair photolyase
VGAEAALTLVEAEDLHPLRPGYEVREITCRTALSRDPLPGLDYGLNPYWGCSQACMFCYVPSLIHVEQEAWGNFVHVKRNMAWVLSREVSGLPRGLVAISTATDPYQYLEAKYLITRHCLEVLARVDWPVSILTRSPLVVRDEDLFRRFSHVRVGFSIPTLDDEARKLLEPYAPSIKSRLRSLGHLSDLGFQTWVSLAPAYPPTRDFTAEGMADALAATGIEMVRYRELDLKPGVRSLMLKGLEGSPLRDDLLRFTDRSVMEPFVADLGRALEARGIEFSHFWRRRRAMEARPRPPATGP